tara:strand:+ start:6000 stop:8465 length:2466 start_codon:yes stop_codon:yes gene_type:complete
MAVTETSYTGNGSTTNYSFTFPYLKSTDIQVLVDNLLKTAGTDWSLANATTVQFNSAPADQSAIKIRRQTNVDSLAATFYAGSAIKSEDLNDNATQNIYVAQEINDRYLDNDGATITGNFVLAKDADIIYEGSTSNDFETTLTVADPTADRTITLPNVTGTVVTTGDTGSVTVGMMGTNSVDSDELVADSVITSKILDDNVTYAKIQNVSATDRVLGRDSSGAGIIEEITPTALRTMINVEDGAEVNVQSDWNASSGDAQILNKPAIVELIDEDNFSSDTATKAPTQQSAKAYIDTQVSGHLLDEDDFASDSATKPPSQQSAKAYIGTYAQPKDTDLTTLAGMPSATASILAGSPALESNTTKLNLLSDKSIVTTISSPTDVQIPTAQAVEERIVSLVTDVGGFRPIANETSFPATNPDPEDNAGTIVSIKALASDLTSNGSGVATIANGAGTGNTVTITGMANSDTIEAGKGILVETTTTSGDGSASPPREYTFHRETLAPADITAAKTAVDDFNQRYQVAGSQPSNQPDGTDLAEGDLWFDSGTDTMKVYDGSSYAAVTSVGDYKLLTVVPDGATSGSPDYSNLSFDLRDGGSAASVTSVGQLLVSVNGVLQKPNSTSWSASNEGFHLEGTNGIKFCTAPGAGASVFVTLIGSATTVNTPATNSIQEAMIQTNQVSEEKLKISNGGSNGQFLQKQSGNDGGLTWATVTTTPTDITVADESSDTTCFPLFVTAATGDLAPKTGSNLAFNSSSGALTATSFSGDGSALTGIASTSADSTMYENSLTISSDYTVAATKGAHSVGPITINNATVTVNGRWVIS